MDLQNFFVIRGIMDVITKKLHLCKKLVMEDYIKIKRDYYFKKLISKR